MTLLAPEPTMPLSQPTPLTAIVQIGNSDDKLTQKQWATFYGNTHSVLATLGQLHFAGASSSFSTWQNACFVLELTEHAGLDAVTVLERYLARLAEQYDQSSIALTLGSTRFITPSW